MLVFRTIVIFRFYAHRDVGKAGIIVGSNKNYVGKSARDCWKNKPADEGEIQYKYIELVAVHHLTAETEHFMSVDIGILGKQVRNHEGFVAFYRAGYNKEKGP